jgi:hypothetical protein
VTRLYLLVLTELCLNLLAEFRTGSLSQMVRSPVSGRSFKPANSRTDCQQSRALSLPFVLRTSVLLEPCPMASCSSSSSSKPVQPCAGVTGSWKPAGVAPEVANGRAPTSEDTLRPKVG